MLDQRDDTDINIKNINKIVFFPKFKDRKIRMFQLPRDYRERIASYELTRAFPLENAVNLTSLNQAMRPKEKEASSLSLIGVEGARSNNRLKIAICKSLNAFARNKKLVG